jgi:hypothetical protein
VPGAGVVYNTVLDTVARTDGVALLGRDLPPRIAVEVLARDFFGPSASIRYDTVRGEDEAQEVALVEVDAGGPETLAELEEAFLSQVIESYPALLAGLTVVCHRR